MRHVKLKINRDTHTTYSKSVPEWEVAIIDFIFEGNITLADDPEDREYDVLTDREYPTAAMEMDRLARCYGEDPQSGISYAATVYGQAGAGIRALGKAINDAKAAELASQSKPVPRRAVKKRDVSGDSLLT